MFPFPEPSHISPPLLGHLEATQLPLPPPKVDAYFPLLNPFSPPFFDHEILNDLVLLAPPPPPPPPPSRPPSPSTHETTVAAEPRTKPPSCIVDAKGAIGAGRRRALRKDRHSKIFTAQGPRDRRMRLSLDVARKFFNLQDMLGFDKASKTVDWLLTNSQTSIRELTGCCSPPPPPHQLHLGPSTKSYSSTSVDVGEDMTSTGANHVPSAAAEEVISNTPSTTTKAKRAAARRSRKATTHPTPSRKDRLMKRAWARERTREKKEKIGFQGGGKQKQQLLAAGEDSSGMHDVNAGSLEDLVAGEGQPSSYFSPEVQHKKELSCSSPPAATTTTTAVPSSPISIFDYYNPSTGGAINFVQEHWSMQSSGNTEDQRALLADIQFQSWLWEAFSPCI